MVWKGMSGNNMRLSPPGHAFMISGGVSRPPFDPLHAFAREHPP